MAKDPLAITFISRVGLPVPYEELESDYKSIICRSLVIHAMKKGLITVQSEFSERHDATIYSMRLEPYDSRPVCQ